MTWSVATCTRGSRPATTRRDSSPATKVAGDESQRVKLLAAILLLQVATDQVTSDFDFNELRRKLGLPTQEPIDPAQVALAELPLPRLSRVDVKKLSDEDLADLYRRADHYRHVAAIRTLAHEIVERPGLDSLIEKSEVYGILAQIEPDTQKAIAYLEQARKAAEASKASTAPWDLAELALRIARGDVAEADRLLHHIRDEHIREPGVAQAMFQILSEAGIIGPDGKPTAAAAGRSPRHRRARRRWRRARQNLDPRQRPAQRQEVGLVDAGRLSCGESAAWPHRPVSANRVHACNPNP